MNDFTKEELIAISQYLRMAYKSGFDTYDDLPTAYHCYSKIQPLIDNYNECKHSLTMTDTFVKCQDCGKVIGYD